MGRRFSGSLVLRVEATSFAFGAELGSIASCTGFFGVAATFFIGAFAVG